jgi:hypothetical protein
MILTVNPLANNSALFVRPKVGYSTLVIQNPAGSGVTLRVHQSGPVDYGSVPITSPDAPATVITATENGTEPMALLPGESVAVSGTVPTKIHTGAANVIAQVNVTALV